MSAFEPTIGLEIHAELKTRTKMFCSSKNDPDETRPNVNICPVCMGHPGTLPVINREAVRHVMRVGLAVNGEVADYTEFDRKNYFYPDLPRGYQLSQFAFPIVSGGTLNGVAITRVHLEEDTASSIHVERVGTTIDYNRAGVPLMELVTEPVITSSAQAGAFARELQLLLRHLGASEGNMEKGEMRVEANISLREIADERRKSADIRGENLRQSAGSLRSSATLGTKVEIKNLNSFRAMERAIEYEIKRQKSLISKGGEILQETRGWDEAKQETFSQRAKEGSADYRYFPDPDLPSLKLSELGELSLEKLRESLGELPLERKRRYENLGIKAEDAELYVHNSALGAFFEEVISGHENDLARVQLTSNYTVNDLLNLIRDTEKRDTEYQAEIPISAHNFSKIISMLTDRKISSRAAKDILALSVESGRDPEEIAKTANLYQVSSGGDFEALVGEVLSKNVSVVADLRAGKSAALEYLVGQCMKGLRGADPVAIRTLILTRLSEK